MRGEEAISSLACGGRRARAVSRIFMLAGILFLGFAPTFAFAVTPEEMLADPKLEARARALSTQLRCMVCQNELIDELDAVLAHDIRVLIRQRIVAGDSNAAIKAFLVSRYGDFVLLKPPFKPETYLLWATPVLLLLAGGAAIIIALRKQKPLAPASLTAAEQQRLAALVGEREE